MLKNVLGYSYQDVAIIPARLSGIKHRSECKVGPGLPLFASPMSTVVDEINYPLFQELGIQPIMPRNIPLETRLQTSQTSWAAFGLEEFRENLTHIKFACIDIANGHMKCLLDLVKEAKWKNPEIQIMTGNIANPETYLEYLDAGVDYCRVSVGTGFGCISSTQVSIHAGIASLLDRIKDFKSPRCKVVADGGVRGYADIIKALALGADYVMIGSVFAKSKESAAPGCEGWKTMTLEERIRSCGPYKTYYGMASARGQIDISGSKTKTAEGTIKEVPVEYSLRGWTENFKDYLRSAMSYTGAHTIEEFKENAKVTLLSPATQNSINK